MKTCVLLMALLTVAVADQYTTKYDNINLDQILRSDRLMKNYLNCLLEKGKCSPDGLELRKHLPDAINNGCSKCSERQKQASRQIIRHLIEKKRNWWNELEAKYDPTGTYRRKYEAEINSKTLKL